ncbi:MAG: hypothetical protein M3Q69_01205 [Acidobacteriota bacterium]|nr:hypothetical protein [Acidobacteriota bacterium]
MIIAALLLASSLFVSADAGVRVVNPHGFPVDATLVCAGSTRTLHLDAEGVADYAAVEQCRAATVTSNEPLLVFETAGEEGAETQKLAGSGAPCGDAALFVPLFACRFGTATASVQPMDGATYRWSAEGAAIEGASDTPRVTLQVGTMPVAKVTATVTRDGCTQNGTGVIAVREPLTVRDLAASEDAQSGQPMTVTWAYVGDAQPASQLLVSDALEAPVAVAAAERSYTFTPASGGRKNIELRASYAPAVAVPQTSSRRRSVGSTLVAASCPSARASMTIEVRGCGVDAPRIRVPELVESGATFTAAITIDRPDDAVQWTVDNATVIGPSNKPKIELRAETQTEVRLTVRVTRGAGCSARATTKVRVDVVPACPVRPTASLSVVSQTCGSATVKATFTGKAPFSGIWSDGTPFSSSSDTAVHEFFGTGTYSITGLRDSACTGSVTQTAQVKAFRPLAQVRAVTGGCASQKIAADFSGLPPFSGTWSDGQTFTTSSTHIERSTAAKEAAYWIASLTDARCSSTQSMYDTYVLMRTPPAAVVQTAPFCQTVAQSPATMYVNFDWGVPPYTVEWSDGVKSVSSGTVTRTVFINQPSATFTIARASTGNCEATIPNKTATVVFRKPPVIDDASVTPTCMDELGSASLLGGSPAGATIEWTLEGGYIVEGQGTAKVTWKATGVGAKKIRAIARYADGFCGGDDEATAQFKDAAPAFVETAVEPATIKAGGTATFSFTFSGNNAWAGTDIEPASRRADLRSVRCSTAHICTATYTDTVGPGVANLVIRVGNGCRTVEKKIPLTIAP